MSSRLLLQSTEPSSAVRGEGTAAPVSCSLDAGAANSSRSDRFLKRIDAHLPSLANAHARRSFLRQQIAGWELRRERFILSEGASEPVTDPRNPPHVSDFVLTITALQTRLEKIHG